MIGACFLETFQANDINATTKSIFQNTLSTLDDPPNDSEHTSPLGIG
jgi:hypothetical protein